MPKFYKVPVRDENCTVIANAIVTNTPFGVKEIVTNHEMDKYFLLNSSFSIKKEFVENDKKEFGWYGFVAREDIKRKNVATPEEVEAYLDNYENSEFQKLFKSGLRQKVNRL